MFKPKIMILNGFLKYNKKPSKGACKKLSYIYYLIYPCLNFTFFLRYQMSHRCHP